MHSATTTKETFSLQENRIVQNSQMVQRPATSPHYVTNHLWVTPDQVTQTESHVETDVLFSRRCLTHGGTVIKSTKGKITKQKGNPN